MEFSLDKMYEILEWTPKVLNSMLHDLSEEWIFNNEGPDTFSPFDVVGHLLHGEKEDYITRANIILNHGTTIPFTPFDRFAQYEESKGKTIQLLLEQFSQARHENLAYIKSLNLTEDDLAKEGMHPVLGIVTLKQLLTTWAVHDLTHIAQISRVMAKQYKEDVGPWVKFMRLLEY
jgi:hypothetical protein